MRRQLQILGLVALGLAFAGSSKAQDDGVEAEATGRESPSGRSRISSVGTLRLQQASVLPGSTGVGSSPRVLFRAIFSSGGSVEDSLASRLAQLKSSFFFVDEERTKIRADLELQLVKEKPGEQLVMVVSEQPLREDTWYWLEASGPDWLSFGDASASVTSSRTHSSHFFTGSAPRVVGIEIGQKDKAGSPWRIHFSEPVDLSTLDTTKLMALDGQPLPGCIQLNGSCGAAPEVRMGVVDFVPETTAYAPGVAAARLSFYISTSAESGLRASEEGLAAAAKHLVDTVPAEAWFDCQQGAAKCWRDSRPLPAVP